MYSKTLSALAIISAITTVNAQGVVANARVAKSLQSEGVPISGNYKIVNVKTGRKLTYVHDEQANLYPADDTVSQILRKLGDGSGLAADDVFELKPSFRGDPSTRIRNVPSNKVLSAQWDHDIGRDEYGVAYNCAYGDESECFTDTLEPYKQFWLFIAVEGRSTNEKISSASSKAKVNKVVKEDESEDEEKTEEKDDDKSEDGSGCSKPGDWLHRNGGKEWYAKHPECEGLAVAPVCSKDAQWLSEHTEYVESHPECEKTLKKAGMLKRSHKEIAAALKKRASPSSGTYYIVSMDHIEDMTTRSITGTQIDAFADAMSTHMVDFDRDDEGQMWEITKVD